VIKQEALRRIVVANFFPAFYPPTSGGEQRYFHLYQHLSKRFDVTLVSATYADHMEEVVEHSLSFREYRVPKHPDCDSIHLELQLRGIGPECSGYVVALAGALDSAFGLRLRELVAGADFVIHESPFTVPYDLDIGRDNIPRIYNAYNVETSLACQMLCGEAGAQATQFIEDLERHLLGHSALVFATSPEERDAFIRDFDVDASKILLAPNGYEASAVFGERSETDLKKKHIVFLGSQHPPNLEALKFIASRIAPVASNLHFDVLGGVCKTYDGPLPGNMTLHGFVSAQEKSQKLLTCAAAINPLFSGAGTNLKMLDYMAHGAPILTTEVGARGLGVIADEHVLLAAPENFVDILQKLVAEPEIAKQLGNNARALARERYSWQAIAQSVGDAIDRLPKSDVKPRRKHLLSLCDYPVDAPAGGGQVRVQQLLRELGREFDVTLVCLTDDIQPSKRWLGPGAVQHSIPKTPEHRAEQRQSSKGERVSIADLVSARQCLQNAALVAAIKEELARTDLVLFEQCYLAPLLDLVPSSLPVVYSSQNHEVTLKKVILSQRRDSASVLREVGANEQLLMDRANLLVCVCEADAKTLTAHYPEMQMLVVENGVHVPEQHRTLENAARFAFGEPLAVFVGSGHPPNARAARFIAEVLAPATPDVLYAIVGSVCDGLDAANFPPNVILLGFLSDDEKKALLELADIAVNPLFEGGGSSLKVPDFFSAGLPTVSSAIGVRGYSAQDCIHYLEADPEHFADAVRHLISDHELRTRIGINAYRLVKRNFDWRILGGKLRRGLREQLPRQSGRKRLLALTYRFGEPPRGGAETFLAMVLPQLKARDWDVTVAATAVGAIQNHLMFSAIYESPATTDRLPGWADDVHLFPVDESVSSVPEDCRRLHELWMEESRLLGRRFLDALPDAALAGGWNHPEPVANNRVGRWASARAQLRGPISARQVRFELYAPQPVQVLLRQSGVECAVHNVEGAATLVFDLMRGGGLLELECSRTYCAPGDPRELGVLVTAAYFIGEGVEQALDLCHELDILPHRLTHMDWVGALIDVTEARNPADDELFLRVRGPHSLSLTRWLDANVSNYDVLLVQGVPFAISALGVEVARHAGVPVIVLPHAHIEDRYYHWQSFYDAYRDADHVIAAPNASVKAFYDRIGANATAVPGGGVSIEEFSVQSLESGRQAFRVVYESKLPYVLVLGRKADGKNYQLVVDAHARLRAQGVVLNLVMIGPDEDGRCVSGAGVSYLGSQPREVVIGALAEALCLINMSESESFGIVILEAWLAGAAVIANGHCLAFSELVQDRFDGRLVTTSGELELAIREYVLCPSNAKQHAEKGARKAEEYTWSNVARNIADLCNTIAVQQHVVSP
jgi:glycosyltransferase involved in cell wall biosynthesis